MPSPSLQREPTDEYLICVEREEEIGRLRNQVKIRKSLLSIWAGRGGQITTIANLC